MAINCCRYEIPTGGKPHHYDCGFAVNPTNKTILGGGDVL